MHTNTMLANHRNSDQVGMPGYSLAGYAHEVNHDGYTMGAMAHKNHLVEFATPLITLITHIKKTTTHNNVPLLRTQIIEEIQKFEKKALMHDYSKNTIAAARYCLCTAIDEAVFSRPWGCSSVWAEASLLSISFNQTFGGENFYVIAEQYLQNPKANIDFLEFVFFLMSMGFEGKLHGQDKTAFREEFRHKLFWHIKNLRPKPEKTLSKTWKLFKYPLSDLNHKRKLKKTFWLCLMALALLGLGANISVYYQAQPTLKKLESIGQNISPSTTYQQLLETNDQ